MPHLKYVAKTGIVFATYFKRKRINWFALISLIGGSELINITVIAIVPTLRSKVIKREKLI